MITFENTSQDDPKTHPEWSCLSFHTAGYRCSQETEKLAQHRAIRNGEFCHSCRDPCPVSSKQVDTLRFIATVGSSQQCTPIQVCCYCWYGWVVVTTCAPQHKYTYTLKHTVEMVETVSANQFVQAISNRKHNLRNVLLVRMLTQHSHYCSSGVYYY